MEVMQVGTPVLVALIATALLFDFLNGLHDSANSIATVVSTRVLKPLPAVLLAAFFNFIAFGVFGLHVANTMGNGVVSAGIVDPLVVFGALGGAIFWNVLTWRLGLPSSSSHALVSGLVGAGMAKAGPAAVIWGGLGTIGSAIVLSPLVGFVLALQLVSSSLLSLGYGGNDAQKTMSIIAVLLLSQGRLEGGFHVPFWVVLSCQAATALGTMAGGWRIVRAMGSRITHLTPMQGFCAETGGAATLFGATWLGVPVSTTHTIAGSIVGVGAARRVSAVRWGVARGIVVAWVVTMPAGAVVGAACYALASLAVRA